LNNVGRSQVTGTCRGKFEGQDPLKPSKELKAQEGEHFSKRKQSPVVGLAEEEIKVVPLKNIKFLLWKETHTTQ
jgi:hypothetical protein